MPLTARLDAAVSADGFSLDASVAGLEELLSGFAPPALQLDRDAIANIGDSLASADTSAILEVIGPVVEAAIGLDLPDPDALLGPLLASAEVIAVIASDAPPAAIAALEAAGDGVGLGIDGLRAGFGSLDVAARTPTVQELADLAGRLLPELRISSATSLLGTTGDGIAALVQLLGGLVAVEGTSRETLALASRTASFWHGSEIEALVARIRLADARRLGELLVGIDPDDELLVELVAGPIAQYAAAVRTLAEELRTAMGFGEALLVGAGVGSLSLALDAGTVLLDEGRVGAVGRLAVDIRRWVSPVVDAAPPRPEGTVEDLLDQATGLVGDLAATVDGINASALGGPVQEAISRVIEPLRAIERLAHEASASLEAAFGALQTALAAIDLQPVADALRTLTGPATTAMTELTELVESAQAAIEAVLAEATAALEPVVDAVEAAAEATNAAVGAAAGVIDELDIDGLVEGVRTATTTAGTAIESVPIRPVFDVAADALDTAASLLGAVPRSLLPDEVKTAIDEACAPLEALDLESVRRTLQEELTGIRDEFDTSVLSAVREARGEIVAFLATINPRPPLEALRNGPMAEVVRQVREIDPSEVLAPLTEALDGLREAVQQLDPDAFLAPIDEGLDAVAARVTEFDPGALVAPVVESIDLGRTWLDETLRLQEWQGWLDEIERRIDAALDGFEPARLSTLLDAAWDGLSADVRSGGDEAGAAIATVLSGLLEGSGARVRGDSLPVVSRWIRHDEDGSEVVAARMRTAATILEDLARAVRAIDPQALSGELGGAHASLDVSLRAFPAESRLRLRLDGEVASATPAIALGPLLENRDRYLLGIDTAAALLRRQAASGRSEVSAVAAGLRTALAPLTELVTRLRGLLVSLGINAESGSLGAAFADLLAKLRPATLLLPFIAAWERLKAAIRRILVDGVLAPARAGAESVAATVAAIDIGFLSTELAGLRDEVVARIDTVRPRAQLGDALAAFEALRTSVATFDPLAPVQAAIDAFQAAVTDLTTALDPTVTFAPALAAYDGMAASIAAIDVDGLLEPVLHALDSVAAELDAGMTRVIGSLDRVKAACASEGGLLDVALNISASVDVGAVAGGIGF